MNTQGFRPLYNQFTPEERVHLVLAATARRDEAEVTRLHEGCPRVKVLANDPQYTELLDGMWHAGTGILCHWLDVSHRVVRSRLAVAVMKRYLLVDEMLMRTVPDYRKQLKIALSRDRAVLVSAEAQYKKWSAAWKGTEAAITRFCAERRFTTRQLFAMVKHMPLAIEEARADLDADVSADRQEDERVYQALCHAVLARMPTAEDSRRTR